MMLAHGKKQIDPNLKPEELARQAYAKAIRLLGAREHASAELSSKLQKNGFDDAVIASTLQQLQDSGYQSDERFANLYAEQLLRKYQGPLVIRAKLAARGIDSSLSRDAIDNLDVCWANVAADALHSRFSMNELTDSDQNAKGKVARFLTRRGFSPTDAIKATRLVVETVPD